MPNPYIEDRDMYDEFLMGKSLPQRRLTSNNLAAQINADKHLYTNRILAEINSIPQPSTPYVDNEVQKLKDRIKELEEELFNLRNKQELENSPTLMI